MNYPSDYFPVQLEPGVVELRIHGVSGTPPEGLLKKPPVLVAGDEASGFYRADPNAVFSDEAPGIVEAYSWGALTAGKRFSAALRILLLPFSVMNVSGWMVPGVWDSDGPTNGGGPTRPESTQGADADKSKSARTARIHILISRVLALVLTLYAVLGTYWLTLKVTAAPPWDGVDLLPLVAGIDLPGSPGVWLRGLQNPTAAGSVAFAIALVMLLVWAAVSKRKAVPGENTTSDAQLASIAAGPMVVAGGPDSINIANLWSAAPITQVLARTHFLAGMIFLAVLHATIANPGMPGVAWWYLLLLIPVTFIVCLSSKGPAGRVLRKPWPGILTGASVVAVAVAVALAFDLGLRKDAPLVGEDSFATTTQLFALVVFVTTVLIVVRIGVARSGGPFWPRLYAAAFSILGLGAAIIGYVGGAVILIGLLTSKLPESEDFTIAVALSVLGLCSVGVVVAGVVLSWNPLAGRGDAAWATRLRATTSRLRGFVVAGAAIYSIPLVIIFATWVVANWTRLATPNEQLERFLNPTGDGLHWAAVGWYIVSCVVGALLAAAVLGSGKPDKAAINTSLSSDRHGSNPAARSTGKQSLRAGVLTVVFGTVILVAGLAMTTWVHTRTGGAATVGAQWPATKGGLDEAFAWLALVVAMIAPVAGIIWYMVSLSAKANARRIVGVLWDLANFWPRHFHPWAPQPYSDRTIPDVVRRITVLRAEAEVKKVVVSAHSQGANTALPAILKLWENSDGVDDGKVKLLTYGVLLNSHYRWLFPWIFNPALTSDLNDRLDKRWRNLYRVTDPLGHPIPGAGDVDGVNDLQRIDDAHELDLHKGLGPGVTKTMLHSDYQYAAKYRAALVDLGASPQPPTKKTPQRPRRGGS